MLTLHRVHSETWEQATCSARRETFQGRPFRVVSAVLVRSQVLRNNLGTSFLPAAEITDDWASQWNGVPVLVGPHPTAQGISTSGRTPEIWNDRAVGFIFNAKADTKDGVRRLVGEVWLDESRASDVPGFSAVLSRVSIGQPVELSTGFTTQTEQTQGVHNGQAYDLVLHPDAPDHLVISTDMTGACSVADGCGLGTNKEVTVDEGTKNVTSGDSNNAPPAEKSGFIKRAMARLEEVVQRTLDPGQKLSWYDHEALRVDRGIVDLELMPSDDERRQMVREALQAEWGASDREVVVSDLFSDKKVAIFWFSTAMGPMPKGAEFYRANWTENADGKPMFSGQPELVRRQVTYEVVTEPPAALPAALSEPTPEVTATKDEAKEPDLASSVASLTAQLEAVDKKLTSVL